MIEHTLVSVNWKNNSKQFWRAFRECLSGLARINESLYKHCVALDENDQVTLVGEDANEFRDFVESLPGYESEGSYAELPLVWQHFVLTPEEEAAVREHYLILYNRDLTSCYKWVFQPKRWQNQFEPWSQPFETEAEALFVASKNMLVRQPA